MIKTTVGQALINHRLPEDLRDYARTLDKKGVAALFDRIAHNHPDRYSEIAKGLSDVGRDVAYGTGGFSFGLNHMQTSKAARTIRENVKQAVAKIHADRSMGLDAKDAAIISVLRMYQKPLEKAVYDESLAEKNPLAYQVMNVGRGNPTSLKSLRAGDLMYEDHRGNPIAVPILHSYSEGLRPHEYWAASFGARKGVRDVKMATAEAGFFAKQLNQLTHRLVVTANDDRMDDEDDDNTPSPNRDKMGLPIDADDPDNEGALLAQRVGPFDRNTVLTPRVLRAIRTLGHDRILIRSPIVGGPRHGGVFAEDVGVRERGVLPQRGEFVGVAGAQALSEKVSQGGLSSKHAGGVAGANQAVSGFKYINQLVQAPKAFRGGAAHAQKDGRVDSIREAPQGGTYITVNGERHYAAPGLAPTVAVGDAVEAGDVLSEGIPNPSELVAHKGVGEGRRQFIEAFREAYKNSGMMGHRRNIELLARGLIDHVRLSDEVGDYVPDDVVPYSTLARDWTPREGSKQRSPREAVGKYLEAPVLHHTIGTRVKPSMLPDLERFGVDKLTVHDDPPPFESTLVRAMGSLQHDQDWVTRHLGSNVGKGTLDAARRGLTSDTAGTSFVPAVALNRQDFGRSGLTRGWDARDGDGDGKVNDGTPQERRLDKAASVRSLLFED